MFQLRVYSLQWCITVWRRYSPDVKRKGGPLIVSRVTRVGRINSHNNLRAKTSVSWSRTVIEWYLPIPGTCKERNTRSPSLKGLFITVFKNQIWTPSMSELLKPKNLDWDPRKGLSPVSFRRNSRQWPSANWLAQNEKTCRSEITWVEVVSKPRLRGGEHSSYGVEVRDISVKHLGSGRSVLMQTIGDPSTTYPSVWSRNRKSGEKLRLW